MSVLRPTFLILFGSVRGRTALALENLALRQQLPVLWRQMAQAVGSGQATEGATSCEQARLELRPR